MKINLIFKIEVSLIVERDPENNLHEMSLKEGEIGTHLSMGSLNGRDIQPLCDYTPLKSEKARKVPQK